MKVPVKETRAFSEQLVAHHDVASFLPVVIFFRPKVTRIAGICDDQ